MPIFQKSVLQKHFANLDKEKVENAFQTFRLNYNPAKIEQIKTLKEEEYQDGFLREIFVDVLGYTLRPNENYDLQREFKNQTDGKKADGAILKDENAIAVIELKSTKTKDLTKITQQAFNYKNNQPECKYVITSNFQKLRFYIDYSTEFEEFDLFFLDRQRFEVLYLILHQESIFANLPIQLKKETQFHEKEISEDLYNDYSNFKSRLFDNLVANHPDNDKLLLFKKSQKLLDRFLFILFAEDSGLLPPNSISRIIKRFQILKDEDAYKPLYEIFKQYFGYMNIGRKGKTENDNIPAYNGGLFYQDLMLDNLTIDDEALLDDLQKISTYDFNTEVGVNILGHIFEHSLNEIEEVTAEIEGTVSDKKRSKRKKDGVFYTPKYITTYIVAHTVGKLCLNKRKELDIEEIEFDDTFKKVDGTLKGKGKKLFKTLTEYKNWLRELKIVDPACGSGAFLNQALNFLIEEHEKIDDIIAELTNSPLRLFDTDKNILENNLFGVDINEESVEIAQLSLWLRTARKDRKLSKLNNNIKCGNSLLATEFDWHQEFPEIMKNGGFDVVIGNPPYIKEYTNRQAFDGLHDHYCYQGKMDLWYFFGALALDIVKKESGLIGYIAPNNWITNSGASKFRNIILQNGKITEFIDFGDFKVFDSAGIQTMIYIMKRSADNLNYQFDYAKVADKRIKHEDAQLFLEKVKDPRYEYFTASIDQKENLDNPINFVNATLTLIVDKIREQQNFQFDKNEIAQGVVPNPDVVNSRNIAKLSQKLIETKNIQVGEGVFVLDKGKLGSSKFIKPLYEPENFERFYHNPNNTKELIYIPKGQEPELHILEHLDNFRPIMEERRENLSGSIKYYNLHWPRDERFFSKGSKIISLRKCINRPVFSFTNAECYVMLTFNVILTERLDQKYLTGLLNSDLIAFWLKYQGKMQGDLYQVDKGPLMNLPILKPTEEIQTQIATLVTLILEGKQKEQDYTQLLQTAIAENNFDREIQLTKELSETDKTIITAENEINNIVFSLYQMQPEDIVNIQKNILKS
ncbi:MAG: N-6 DNA methylase [Flavobacteriaceae bacterium]|nr:N-6 DNA methylase [Flavobacteriaceae bacterium]